jgi:hypothetical protein
MIIAICGWQGSGKDTIADYLVNSHGFRRDSFASTLKDAVGVIFGWDRELLEGRTRDSRAWREQVDQWWAEKLQIPNLTPRWILQQWGTEVCRRNFHDNIWVTSLENKLRKTTDDIVISDCRFPNEIQALRTAGAKLVWVERGDRPVWYDWAVRYNRAHDEQRTIMRIVADLEESMFRYRIHESEWAWIGHEFDYHIDNNGSLENLYDQVRDLVPDLPAARADLP